MRLRNVSGAKEKLKSSSYVITELDKLDISIFPNTTNPLCIEIGMGKGDFIINMALRNPHINYLGVEKYDSVLVRALEKMNDEIPNLRFVRMDASVIDNYLNCQVDTIYLNFSDPWPKDRHEKRRLTSPNFLKKYDCLFKGQKRIIFKTDNRKLFEYSLISFVNYGYKIENISLDLHNDDIENIETEYERKFSSKGFPIYMVNISKE